MKSQRIMYLRSPVGKEPIQFCCRALQYKLEPDFMDIWSAVPSWIHPSFLAASLPFSLLFIFFFSSLLGIVPVFNHIILCLKEKKQTTFIVSDPDGKKKTKNKKQKKNLIKFKNHQENLYIWLIKL